MVIRIIAFKQGSPSLYPIQIKRSAKAPLVGLQLRCQSSYETTQETQVFIPKSLTIAVVFIPKTGMLRYGNIGHLACHKIPHRKGTAIPN